MNKKIFIIIAILVVLIILLFPKIEALNDGGTKIYKSIVYEVTKVHKIKADSQNEFNEGTIVKIFRKEVYNDVPKDVEIIVNGKEKKEESTTYEKNIEDVTLMLEIPNTWKYEELPRNTENDFYKYALKIYKNNEDKYAVLYYYQQMFGVCGTGRTAEQIDLENGIKVTIGYYDGKETWQDISFYETNKYIAIINYGLDKAEAEEVIDFVKTISIMENNNKNEDISLLVKEDTITSKGATFILKNNTDEDYSYEPAYYLEKKEDNKWNEIVLEELLSWNSVIYTLKAREETEINVDWSITGYGVLKDGEYRLVKTNFRKKVSPDSRAYSLYAEFEVKEEKNEHEFIAEIIKAQDRNIIVKPDAKSQEIKSSDKISIGITRPTNGTNDFYVVGNKVKITYNGTIMESYPAQIIATKIELIN